jgi:predicted NUDIX family NTP pyrophosphohydrolase
VKISAGLLMHRLREGELEVLLVHPGGPFWKKKDTGAWFIPKGEVAFGEELLAAAKREFAEETGLTATGPFEELGTVRHKGGKIVHAWGFEGDCDTAMIRSNTFTMEWPPHSGGASGISRSGPRRIFFGRGRPREDTFRGVWPGDQASGHSSRTGKWLR